MVRVSPASQTMLGLFQALPDLGLPAGGIQFITDGISG
jgi:hypothetical protein